MLFLVLVSVSLCLFLSSISSPCFTRERTKPRWLAALRCSWLIVIPPSFYHSCIDLMKSGYQKRCWIEEYILVTPSVSLRQWCNKYEDIITLWSENIKKSSIFDEIRRPMNTSLTKVQGEVEQWCHDLVKLIVCKLLCAARISRYQYLTNKNFFDTGARGGGVDVNGFRI